MALSTASAQALDWDAVQKLTPRDWISVTAQTRVQCEFQLATSDRLFCRSYREDWLSSFSQRVYEKTGKDWVFPRSDVREVRVVPFDQSKGPFSMMIAAGGGGGLDSMHQPTGFGGIKLGGQFSLDLQYDRLQGKNGFSTEGSAVIPVFRIPSFQTDKQIEFVKVLAEPGVGYRAGGGPFGGYSSAKVMAMLLSDKGPDGRVAPYVEYQRRFPFDSPLQGDNRISVGVIFVVSAFGGME
jgi:hypothetical protein